MPKWFELGIVEMVSGWDRARVGCLEDALVSVIRGVFNFHFFGWDDEWGGPIPS